MKSYILFRLGVFIPALLVITAISFVIMKVAPGDAVSVYMNPNVSEQDLIMLRQQLGLDQPIGIQYLKWLKNMLTGNMGYSLTHQQPVLQLILNRVPATLLLSVSSLVCILMISIPLGILSAYKKNSIFDHSVTFFTFFGMSVPSFWLGLMLILIFGSLFHLLPSSGMTRADLIDPPFFLMVWDTLQHLFLPLLTITIGGLAGLTRYIRFESISTLNHDFVVALRGRGIAVWRILGRHVFKHTLLPLITILGLELPGLFTGSYIIEYIFAWPGMGQLGLNAIFSRDYPLIMGILVMTGVFIILGNFIADLLYYAVDPRMSGLKKR